MRENETTKAGAGSKRHRGGRRIAATLAAFLLALSIANPSAADEYDSNNAGHPLKMVAYVLHPVGVVIEYLILRPAYWIGSYEPFKTAFGRED